MHTNKIFRGKVQAVVFLFKCEFVIYRVEFAGYGFPTSYILTGLFF